MNEPLSLRVERHYGRESSSNGSHPVSGPMGLGLGFESLRAHFF
jgi:hypothetical protein